MDRWLQLRHNVPSGVLSLPMLRQLWPDKSDDACKAWLRRACEKKQLLRLGAGWYLMGLNERRPRGTYAYHPFQAANLMCTPSYISLESALSQYNLIPERVETITSVVLRSSFERRTPVGLFSFTHLKPGYFNFGFYRVDEGDFAFLIATPLKALVDYIVVMKKSYHGLDDVIKDLRLDWDEFVSHKKFVTPLHIEFMLTRYKTHRIQKILRQLKKRLSPKNKRMNSAKSKGQEKRSQNE